MKSSLVLLVLATVFLIGCGTTKGLRPEQKSSIKSIYIEDRLSPGIQYVKTGLTIFGNTESALVEGKLVAELRGQIKDSLKKLGYESVEDRQSADAVLIVEHAPSTADAGPRLEGINIQAQSMFGRSFFAMIEIRARFKMDDRESGSRLAEYSIIERVGTGIRAEANVWEEFSDEERKLFTDLLYTKWKEMVEEAFRVMGLN